MAKTPVRPLVSVLMPSYNHAPYVRAAVESVLQQSYEDLELIAIDDASSDATWEVLQSFDDERLRRYRHAANQGAHATLNEAMGMAQGDYIAILNSDDIYSPMRLERLVEAATAVDSAELFMYSDVEFIDAAGASAGEHGRAVDYRALRAICNTLDPSNWFLAGNPAISTSNFFFSSSLAKKVGGFAPLRYTHDWDWALRACRQTMPIWFRETLLSYRVHPGNSLSEDDAWRHIHENSHVQAKALLARPLRADPETESFTACQALLYNLSFHPLGVLFYVLYHHAGVPDARLEELTVGERETRFLKNLALAVGFPEELFHSVRQLAEFKDVIAGQAALLQERWSAIHEMTEDIIERDRTIEAQAQLLVDRLNAIEQMNGMIEERDRCIAAQGDMLQERYRSMAAQDDMIRERDRCIAAQEDMLQERYRSMAAQEDMLQERWHAMQEMSRVIAERQEEIKGLRSDRLVQLALRVRKALRWLSASGGH
jgi:glycosyltransferase involved in cell wall biosynthesis